jgi:Protein of unknown function (DUF2997)
MAEYQRIEYRIGQDGKVTETVIGVTGEACTAATIGIEAAIGAVEAREYRPEYYEGEALVAATNRQQSTTQSGSQGQ